MAVCGSGNRTQHGLHELFISFIMFIPLVKVETTFIYTVINDSLFMSFQ